MNVHPFSSDDFDGRTRLFPLPDLVMFPYALQALHVFEPRYVAMFEHALATDRLFALGLLGEGWEEDYAGRPKVHPVVCLCQIVTHQKKEDDRYDTVVFGVGRARIIEELDPVRSFREVQLELLHDEPTAKSAEAANLEDALFAAVDKMMPGNAPMIRQLQQQNEPEATLSILTDLLAYSLPFHTSCKQALLNETSVIVRANQIVEMLSSHETDVIAAHDFPPRFSQN